MKIKYLFLLPALLLTGCVDKGENVDPTPGPGPGGDPAYVKDAFETPLYPNEDDSVKELPIGNKILSAPDNIKNPVDISSKKEFDLYNSMPSNWSFIQGNNKVSQPNNFYADSAGGGFKYTHKWYGLQSCAFTTWKYVDITLHVSGVFNNTNKKDADAPIMHVYGYKSDRTCILMKTIDQGSITVQKANSDIELQIKNNEMAYVEFRLFSFPYVGDQCYNFGISKITMKGNN